MALGVLASHGFQYGVETYMRRAITYGATKDECCEALTAATVPGDGMV